jgi:hypothetical protein
MDFLNKQAVLNNELNKLKEHRKRLDDDNTRQYF